MSDAPKPRIIAGLTPSRQPDLSRLQASKRPSLPTIDRDVQDAATPVAEKAVPNAVPLKRVASKKTIASEREAETAKTKVSAYLTGATYARARAAFKSTAHLEDDSSWSDFVDTALSREADRREAEYNAGAAFETNTPKLPAGRPLK